MPYDGSFPPFQQYRSPDCEANTHPDNAGNMELLQGMCENLIKATNYLEALRARLDRQDQSAARLKLL